MTTVFPPRVPREALDLVVLAVALDRGGADPTAIVALVDQARASLRREIDAGVAVPLGQVCRLLHAGAGSCDESTVNAALRCAARALGERPQDGRAGTT